jgi:sigma-B regulation protein RsbU (phosphoserine phosphatase)
MSRNEGVGRVVSVDGATVVRLGEDARLAAVRRYEILDTPPDGAFDQIAALAARLFGVPIGIVSIVDTDRIWFKAHHGLDVVEIDRAPGLCASAILGDEPWIVTDAPSDPRALANPLVAGEFGLRFYAGVPLTTHDGFNLGTLCVIDRKPRAVTADETLVLQELAALVVHELELRLSARRAVAASEHRLREVEGLAEALQASLLPPALPDVPHLALAASYHPGSRQEVGGDFYDVFPISERRWGFVVGDVCGKGPRAAGRTSCARYSMRTAAIQQPTPSEVLAVVNQALLADADSQVHPGLEGSFVTALFATVDPGPDRTVVRLAVAGHPLPSLLRADGSVETVGTPGTLLGVLRDTTATDTVVELAPGDTLLFFTDGVLDSGWPGGLKRDGLDEILRDCRGLPPAEIVARVHHAAAQVQRDDIAIVALAA